MAAQVGIGVTLVTEASRLKISAVKPEGGAAASGNIRVGDYLVAINGVHLTSEAHAKELILGTFGTSLQVEISRSGQPITVTLWRGGADAKTKGEAAEKADAAAESKAVAETKAAAAFRLTPDFKASALLDNLKVTEEEFCLLYLHQSFIDAQVRPSCHSAFCWFNIVLFGLL